MKINWGTGIFLFYSIFAACLFYQVYRSTQYDHSLVAENYYEKDLTYQSTFDKLENSMALKDGLTMNYFESWHMVELQFPKDLEGIKGTVLFYRPSTKKKDVLLPIRLDCENKMDIFVRDLAFGKWRLEVDWQSIDTPFLNRFSINIPQHVEEQLLTLSSTE